MFKKKIAHMLSLVDLVFLKFFCTLGSLPNSWYLCSECRSFARKHTFFFQIFYTHCDKIMILFDHDQNWVLIWSPQPYLQYSTEMNQLWNESATTNLLVMPHFYFLSFHSTFLHVEYTNCKSTEDHAVQVKYSEDT